MIRVAFYKGRRPGWKGFWDWIIRTVSRGPYSHTELIFEPHPHLWISSIVSEGVHADYNGEPDPAEWDLLQVDCDDNAAITFIGSELCSGYDWLGVARFALPGFKESKERWFCSEICCAALQASGLLPGVKAHTVSPSALYKLLTQYLTPVQ